MRAFIRSLFAVLVSLMVVTPAFAQQAMIRGNSPKIVVPTVTSDAYTIDMSTDVGPSIILANTGDSDADTWTLPDCDSAIAGTAPYAPTVSTLGMQVNILNNTSVTSALTIAPQSTDQIQGLTSAVNKSISSTGNGAFVSLSCAADDLWVVLENRGFVGDAVNVGGNGGGPVTVVTNTTSISPTSGQLRPGVVYVNTGDSDGSQVTFPDCTAATVGTTLQYYSTTNQTFTIVIASSDTVGGGIAGAAAGDDVDNHTTPIAGDAITLVCTAADTITAIGVVGDFDDL